MTEYEIPLLKKSFEQAPIVRKRDYDYFVHPITDGIPAIDPALLREITEAARKVLPMECDKIVTVEAMGIPVATALSFETGCPVVVIRKRSYGLEGEIEAQQKTGYSESKIYINGIRPGDRVLLVDDVLSTGGTLIATVDGLKKAGAVIAGILVIIEKGEKKKAVEDAIGMPVTTLIKVAVEGGAVIVK